MPLNGKIGWCFGTTSPGEFMKFQNVLLSLVSASGLVAHAPSPSPFPRSLQNGFFREGEWGRMPRGWSIPKPIFDAGFRGELVEDASIPGKRVIRFSHETAGTPLMPLGQFGQSINAKPFLGKRIRFKSNLRIEATGKTGAMLWLKVNRSNQKIGFFDNMAFRPVTQPTWTAAEIIADVAPDAESISLGAILNADRGRMWIAPFALIPLGDTPELPLEKPRPLTPQGVQNLVAFTKAMNYIRFFHPADQAAGANWNRLAIRGMRAMEGAVNTPECARRLRAFFADYAPSVQFLFKGEKARPLSRLTGTTQVVRWEHWGYSENDPRSPYRSRRVFIPINMWQGKGWDDPRRVSTFPLIPGLDISLPTVCYADAKKTTRPRPNTRRQCVNELPEPTSDNDLKGDDRATRLGVVGLAWGVLQHFYPYFEVIKTDWQAALPKALHSAAMDGDGQAFGHTLRRLVAALQDGHGRVLGEGQIGEYVPALGISMVEEQAVVSFSMGSASAVRPGSLVLSVDGEPVPALVARLKPEISAATQGALDAQVSAWMLSGSQGSVANLRIKCPSGKEEEFRLPRELQQTMLKDNRLPAPLAELRPGVWYVDLDRITERAIKEALAQLVKAKGVVFDLRGYPNRVGPDFLGHLSNKPLDWAGDRMAIPIVTQPDRKGWSWEPGETFAIQPAQPRIQGRVAFLICGKTQSLAESWMGVVETNKLAEIVGEPTGGTNGNVNRIHLPGNYQIVWTGVKATKEDGRPMHGHGIHPTIPVSPTLQGIIEGKDEVLEKGLIVVSR
jgi:hypothetical protein